MIKTKNTDIVIVGGNGFIGTHLKNYLDSKKLRYTVCGADLLNVNELDIFFSKNKVNIIIHLAGKFKGKFSELLETNVKATYNLCKIASIYKISKIIYSSTGAVYGSPVNGIQSYENDDLFPDTEYGLSKVLAEKIIKIYTHNRKFNSIILRLSSVIGPNSRGVINSIKTNIIKNHEAVIYGVGNKSRDFVHIDDVCRAIYLACKSSKRGYSVYNISSPIHENINSLVERFKKHHTFGVVHKAEDDTSAIVQTNYDLATIELGYIPTITSLNEEIFI